MRPRETKRNRERLRETERDPKADRRTDRQTGRHTKGQTQWERTRLRMTKNEEIFFISAPTVRLMKDKQIN